MFKNFLKEHTKAFPILQTYGTVYDASYTMKYFHRTTNLVLIQGGKTVFSLQYGEMIKPPSLPSHKNIFLKRQCHEIFDPRFFRQSITGTPRPQINTLNYYLILFRINRDTDCKVWSCAMQHSAGRHIFVNFSANLQR
jgi:hypothetical protein